MPITAITIANFKGIKEPVRVELKPITLLFGPNSSGKSTIVQALHYAREIFERQNLNPDQTMLGGVAIDLGGFESLVHRHDKTLPITIRFDLDLSREGLPNYLEGLWEENRWNESVFQHIPAKVQTAWIEVSVKWSDFVRRPLVKSYEVGTNGLVLAKITTSDDGRQIYLSMINTFNPVFLEADTLEEGKTCVTKFFENLIRDDVKMTDEEFKKLGVVFPRLFDLLDSEDGLAGSQKPIVLRGLRAALPRWGRPLNFDNSAWRDDADYNDRADFEQLLSILIVGPGELVRDALRKFCYLGPLRVIPPRHFAPARTPDESRWANGMTAWDVMFNEEEAFRERVNRWLSGRDQLNSGYRVVVKEYKELDMADPATLTLMRGGIPEEDTLIPRYIQSLVVNRRLFFWEEANKIEVQPLDIGVGISQVLPVIVAAMAAKSGFVAIEQPELHIHPAFQVVLGDLFIEQIHENPNLIFVLETHSEHIMLRFLRRIRETGEGRLPLGAPKLTPEKLAIYFAEKGENGISLMPIRVDEEGDFIDRWPKGFFSERAGELF